MKVQAPTDVFKFGEYVFGYQPAPHHREMVDFINEGIRTRQNTIVLEPRGAAKSTWSTLINSTYHIAVESDVRIGLFSKTADHAFDMSRGIRFTFERNDAFREVFGNLVSDAKWTDKQWIRSGSKWLGSNQATLFAGGVLGQVVSKRFDIILLDDILDEENTANIEQMERVETWFWKTLMPCLAPDGVVIYVGCLATGTPVLMGDGTWRGIEQVKVGERVWSVDPESLAGSSRTVEAVLDQGIAETLRISTRTSSVIATVSHPFLAWHEGERNRPTKGGGPIWKRADELKVGDYIVEVKEIDGVIQYPWMTDDFCWLLGFLFGDGWLTRHDVVCCATGKDEDMNRRLLTALEDWFPTVAFKQTPFGYIRGDNQTVVGALRELGFNGTAKTKRLPEWLFQSPPDFRVAFLRGLCDADGAKVGVSRMTDAIALELTNKGLIEDVRRLALTCGVRPGTITSRTRTGRAPNSPSPTVNESWRISLNFAYVNQPELGDARARKTVSLDPMLGTKWRLAKVKSIEPAGDQQVWDLTVEGSHTFIADGLAVHNTRWAEGDLAEKLITPKIDGGKGWRHLIRGALYEERGELRSYWPDYWSVDTLLEKKEEMGSALFSCAYMNDITGLMAGNIFDKRDFQYFQSLPEGKYTIRMGVDLASSVKERADYTARVTTAEDVNGNFFVLSAHREKISGGHAQFIEDGWAAFPEMSLVIVENQQFQSTLIEEMMRDKPRIPIMGKRADTDKTTRARAVAARYEGKRVFHHVSLQDSDLEREELSFPKGHDDLVDALGYSMDLGGSDFYFASASW